MTAGRVGGGGGGGGGGGNGGKRHMPPRNQTFDSNGPEIRIRGNAHQVLEKYLTLARDAAAQGDRIAAENYYQHAEHYFRVINSQTQAGGRQLPRPLNTPADNNSVGEEDCEQQGDNESSDGEGDGEGEGSDADGDNEPGSEAEVVEDADRQQQAEAVNA